MTRAVLVLTIFLLNIVVWGNCIAASSQPKWFETFTKSTWLYSGEQKSILLFNFEAERYFVFKKNGALFDQGRLELVASTKTLRLFSRNGESKLVISKLKADEFDGAGKLKTTFGELSLQGTYSKNKTRLDSPVPRSLEEAAIYGDVRALKGFLRAKSKRAIDGSAGITVSPLAYAVSNQHNKAVKMLLEHGANPNFVGQAKKPPLSMAVDSDNFVAAKLLIAKGAKVDYKDSGEDSLIFNALQGGSLQMLKLLISKGASFTALDKQGHTVLHRAMVSFSLKGSNINERLSYTQYLVEEAKFDPTTQDQYGRSALFYAANLGLEKTVKYLLAKGVNPNLKDKEGKSVFDYIAGSEHKDNVNPILEKHKK